MQRKKTKDTTRDLILDLADDKLQGDSFLLAVDKPSPGLAALNQTRNIVNGG